MEPTLSTESITVYLPNHCWHGLPGKIFKICGMNAAKYSILRCTANQPNSQVIFMWLCDKHKKAMEKQDYTVVPYKT